MATVGGIVFVSQEKPPEKTETHLKIKLMSNWLIDCIIGGVKGGILRVLRMNKFIFIGLEQCVPL